jgi:hypothetical protein
MRIITVLIMAIISPFIGNCQGRNNLWMLGYSTPPIAGKADIEFSSGVPVINTSNRSINININFANITDYNGDLLFYTNGAVVANKLDIVMPNGDSLSPATYTFSAWQNIGFPIPQASLIIPDPGDSTRFYIFHCSIDVLSNGVQRPLHFYYSVVDMDEDNSLGDLINKNNILISDTISAGNISACKHANGRDWWVIEPEFNAPGYYIFLVSPNGIQFVNKQIIGQRFGADGQSKFNLQGTKYARYDTTNDLDVFDFDRCTGVLSNNFHMAINDSMVGLGVSFSPDGSKLYTSSLLYLYQFDLNSPNIATSKTTVAVWDSTYSPFATTFYCQQLAPDGKIYVATTSTNNVMHIIDSPDSLGLACNVIQHGLQLPVLNSGTVPNHPNYHLGPVVGSICDSLTVGLAENKVQSASLRLNPNPATNQVWVNYNFPNNKDGWLEIYDTMGKLVLKRRLYWSTTQMLVYLNEIKSSGVFVARVYDDSRRFISSEKLIIYAEK